MNSNRQGDALAFGRLGDGDQHLVVLFCHAGPVDDERHADGSQHRLHRRHRGLGTVVALVRVTTAQLQRDQLSAGHDRLPRPRSRVSGIVAPGR